MFINRACDHCCEKETDTKRKAGCGCLVNVCDDCITDRTIYHTKCRKCDGKPTYAEMDRMADEYLHPTEYDYDDLREEERRQAEIDREGAEYKRSLQEHLSNGDWDDWDDDYP